MNHELKERMLGAIHQSQIKLNGRLGVIAEENVILWDKVQRCNPGATLTVNGLGRNGKLRRISHVTLNDFQTVQGFQKITVVNLLSFYRCVISEIHTLDLFGLRQNNPEQNALYNYGFIKKRIMDVFHLRLTDICHQDVMLMLWGCCCIDEGEYHLSLKELEALAQQEDTVLEKEKDPYYTPTTLSKAVNCYVKMNRGNQELMPVIKSEKQWFTALTADRKFLAQELARCLYSRCTVVKKHTVTPEEIIHILSPCTDTPYLRRFRKTLRTLLSYKEKSSILSPLPDRMWFIRLALALKLPVEKVEALFNAASFSDELSDDPLTAAIAEFLKAAQSINMRETCGITYKKGNSSYRLVQPDIEYHQELEELQEFLSENLGQSIHLLEAYPALPGMNANDKKWEQVHPLLLSACGSISANPNQTYTVDFCWKGDLPDLHSFFEFSYKDMKGYGDTSTLMVILSRRIGQEVKLPVKLPDFASEEFLKAKEKLIADLHTYPTVNSTHLSDEEKGLQLFLWLVRTGIGGRMLTPPCSQEELQYLLQNMPLLGFSSWREPVEAAAKAK